MLYSNLHEKSLIGKVRNYVLGKTNDRKNSHYENLSEIINEELFEKIDINSEAFF